MMRSEVYMKQDYYEVLGVSRSATDKELKKQYRTLVKKYHPDTNPGDQQAEQKFREVQEAYGVLGDPKKRKLYDQYGFDESGAAKQNRTESEGNPFHFGGDGRYYRNMHFEGGNPFGQNIHFEGDPNDLFGDLFGNVFGDRKGKTVHFQSGDGSGPFEGFREHTGFDGNDAFSGSGDVTSEIQVDLQDAVLGADKKVSFQLGDGRMHSLIVHIPAGIEEGQSIRLKGQGQTDRLRKGDLYLQVHILPRKGVERKGSDLYMKTMVPFTTAVLGGEVKIQTLDHKTLMVKIPQGTQSGSKIRMKGKGMPSLKNKGTRGDLYAVVEIIVPRNLTEEEKECVKKLDELMNAKKAANAA